ncbi:MAG: SPOR domain-containing protein [Ghiorsea sp.]
MPKLSSFITSASEQKYSAILATLVTIAVAITVIWVSFFSKGNTSESTKSPVAQPLAVQITEKPNIKQLPDPTPTPHTKKAHNKTNHAKKVASPQRKTPEKQVIIGQGKLYVQVGAFKEAKGASLTVRKMKARYKRAKVTIKSGFHLVWVGPVATKAEAESLKRHIQRRDHIRGFITSEK